jgi:NADH-quinone oxidoreductase subunit J
MLTSVHLLFYLFAAIAVGSAVSVITVRNPVRSVLSLVVTFFAMSGIWMLLRAEFLALILLLVYVGAVMTLFLFVVMMLNINRESKQGGFVRYLPFGIVLVVLMLGLIVMGLGPQYFGLTQMPAPVPEAADFSNTQQIGTLLYTKYVYAFELSGALLMVAIIAAIALTNRGPLKRKSQNVADQIAVRPQDRLRLIKGMDAS